MYYTSITRVDEEKSFEVILQETRLEDYKVNKRIPRKQPITMFKKVSIFDPKENFIFGQPKAQAQPTSFLHTGTGKRLNTAATTIFTFGQPKAQAQPTSFLHTGTGKGLNTTVTSVHTFGQPKAQAQPTSFLHTGTEKGLNTAATSVFTFGQPKAQPTSFVHTGTEKGFKISTGVDEGIRVKSFCISAMKEYEGKSFEELRMEDYKMNRKTPQKMPIFSFGQSSLFNPNETPIFKGPQQHVQKPIPANLAPTLRPILWNPIQPKKQLTPILENSPQSLIITQSKEVTKPESVMATATSAFLNQEIDTSAKISMSEDSLAANPYGDSSLNKLVSLLEQEEKITSIRSPRPRFREKNPKFLNTSTPTKQTNCLSNNVPMAGEKILNRSIPVNEQLLKKSPKSVSPITSSPVQMEVALTNSKSRTSIKYLNMEEVKIAVKSIKFERDPDELPSIESEDHIESKTTYVALPHCETESEPRGNIEDSFSNCAPAGVTFKNSDYYCQPSIQEMEKMVENGNVILPNGLTIGRKSYGKVYWPGPLKLKDIIIDEIVIIGHKEVVVYPDGSKKPILGEGLNRPAEITIESIWFTNKETNERIMDSVQIADLGYRDRLERAAMRMGGSFKDYRPETGSWVFRIPHFGQPNTKEGQ